MAVAGADRILCVEVLRATGLGSIGALGKGDLCCAVKLVGGQTKAEFRTQVLEDAESNPVWKHLGGFRYEIPARS